jgi:hypothetical protein
MKNPGYLPQWQTERLAVLQRACKAIKAAVASGEKISHAIKLQSRRYDGQPFRCDPGRRLRLRPGTLRQLWDKWKKAGETPAVFDLKFSPQSTAMTAPILIRFVHYCAGCPSTSLRAAWLNFCATPKDSESLPSYNVLARHFSKLHFHELQKLLAAAHAAKADLEILKHKIIADLRRRMPE